MNNPIGKIAAALPLAQAAPVQESVIKTLGIVILSNYGKILMLAGAACLIGYAIRQISGPRLSPEDQKKVMSGIVNNAKRLALLEGPKAPHMINAIKLDGNSWIHPDKNNKDQCMTLIIDGSPTHYYLSVNNDIVRTILIQAGVTDKELSLLPDDAWITLHINNQKLTAIECYETVKLPLNIEFIYEPKMLP